MLTGRKTPSPDFSVCVFCSVLAVARVKCSASQFKVSALNLLGTDESTRHRGESLQEELMPQYSKLDSTCHF